jgi:hypothetical protein
MLLERAVSLAEKINHYEQLKAAAGQASMYRTRASQFETAKKALAEARLALERFDQAAIPVKFDSANTSALIEKANSFRKLFHSNPATLTDPPFDLRYEFLDRVSAIGKFAKEALDRAWQGYVEDQGVNSSTEVLDALAKLPQFRASVTVIKECRERIDRIARQTPSDIEAAKATLGALVEEHRSAWSAISADGIPNTVIVFLRNSAATGVPLSDLTVEVRKWLETRGLLSAFRVRIG